MASNNRPILMMIAFFLGTIPIIILSFNRQRDVGYRESPVVFLVYCAPFLFTGRVVLCPFVGSTGLIRALYQRRKQAVMDSAVLVVSREDMAAFSYANPGVYMAIHDLQFVC